jgi:hypothetical protein
MLDKLIGMKVKLIVGAAVLAVVGTFITMHVLGDKKTEAKLETALIDVGTLTAAVEDQKAVIEAQAAAILEWQAALAELKLTMETLVIVQQEASAETRRLNDIFSKHDLDKLALAKPGLIERRINSGTATLFRMYHDESARGVPDPG